MVRISNIATTTFLVASIYTISVTATSFSECGSTSVRQADYRGGVAKTVSGRECQRWETQSPHSHSRTPEKYPDYGLDGVDNNYCRNPDGEPRAWCYTTDPNSRWEFCAIPDCYAPTPTDCGSSAVKQSDYRGTTDYTSSGRECQRWDAQSPHGHSRTAQNYPTFGLEDNYCRNPDGEPRAWCYTTDQNKRWEYCDIPECGPSEPPSVCYDYTGGFNIGPKDCTSKRVLKELLKVFMEMEGNDEGCEGGFDRELFALTQTNGIDDAFAALQDMCDGAIQNKRDYADTNGWQSLTEQEDYSIDLDEFFRGKGFLNDETGNFQQYESTFFKRGGYDKFFYIGEDTRQNDYMRTTDESYFAGQAISAFYKNEASRSFLTSPSTLGNNFQEEGSCSTSNAAVCCWSRDRQYFDNNGNCNFGDCKNKNPADNTDLCWTEADNEVFPYPGDETENDLHCHGFAWAQDNLDDNADGHGDINAKAKWNNLFFVSMYDHLYQRGYADSITDETRIAGQQAMCGCVEDMNPVARADCTEVIEQTNYTAFQSTIGGVLQIQPAPGTFQLEFKACEGYDYVDDFGPEDYAENPNAAELQRSANDLSAFVFRQYLEGKIDDEHVNVIEQTLIGYRDPSVNDGDDEREAACKTAFEERYPDLEWVEREQLQQITTTEDIVV